MQTEKHICFTFAGDVSRDSRLSRFTSSLSALYRVTVIALSDAEVMSQPGVQLVNVPPAHPSLRRSLPLFWRRAAAMATDLAADMYIAADLYTLPASARAARRRAVPLVYDSRELYSSIAALQGRRTMQRFWALLERVYAKRAQLLLTVNESIADLLLQRGYDNVVVLRNLPDWRKPSRTQRLREVCGLPGHITILLSQGGLQQGRGAFTALEAVHALPDCALVFLGDGPLGPCIRARAAELDITHRVHVLPSVPARELAEWTASADIGLCLVEELGESYRLSLPNKLFEYLAAGLPIIASDLPEIAKVLRESRAGYLVRPSSSEDVATGLRRLTTDAAFRNACRDNANQASEKYTWALERDRLLQALDRLLT
jgi:glycosyltransferase involved in cell wall biosynthesis